MSQGKRYWAHVEGYWGKASIQCPHAQDEIQDQHMAI